MIGMKENLITIKRKDETITLTTKEVSEAMEDLLLHIAKIAVESACTSNGYKLSDYEKEIIANKVEYGVYMSIIHDTEKRVELLLKRYDNSEE